MGFARFFLSLSYSSYSVCIYNIYNITVCNNYILFVRLWANSFRATDEHKLRALYLHLKSVLLMSFVIYVLYMCTYCVCMCNVFTCVCSCVCAYVSVPTRPTTFVSRARNVNVALSSSRETLIASERTSVRIASRPFVTHTHTHGEGDFGTYIINNRTTRRYDTTHRWWSVRRYRATHTSWWACVCGCYWCAIRFLSITGAFTIRGFRGWNLLSAVRWW